jgi:hypothetical protein
MRATVSEVLASPGQALAASTIANLGPRLRPLIGVARPSRVAPRPEQLRVGALGDPQEQRAELVAQAATTRQGRPEEDPLRPDEQQSLEAVRVHTDGRAARSAQLLGADAYALGGHIVFGASRYAPTNPAGRRLIAHELAHALTEPLAQPSFVLRRQASSASPSTSTPALSTPAPIPPTQPTGADLSLQFQSQMSGGLPDYDDAALTLNGMSTSDIEAEVSSIAAPARVELFKAALRMMLLWPAPLRVADAIYKFDPGSARQGRIEYFAETVAASDWRRAALTLNGFSDLDIRAQLSTPPLSSAQLSQIRDAATQYMAGWNSRILQPIHDILQGAVAGQMGSMLGQSAKWVPSGPGSGNTFESWASAATEGAAPTLQPITTINCWEMVLLAAFRTGAIDWKWIHDAYTASPPGRWDIYLAQRLTPSGRQTYNTASPAGPRPQRGDVVLFHGIDHVALATGGRDATGGAEVYSFWPPPDKPSIRGTVDAVKITSIEKLARVMGPVPIEFGPGPW